MKFKILSVILLSLSLYNRINAAPPYQGPYALSQAKFGAYLVQELMHGDSVSIAPFFEDSVRPNLTKPVITTIQQQINWLSKFLGDGVEQFATGTQQLDSTGKEKAFFREYRLSAESNKRSPLLVVHVWFKDSIINQASGAFVKSFLADGEKVISGKKSWVINGQNIDINDFILVQIGKDSTMLAIEGFYDDTAKLDTGTARRWAIPLIRKAVAEGYVDTAHAHSEGRHLISDIGVAIMLKDPEFGFVKRKIGIKPVEYMTPEDYKKYLAEEAAAKKSKTEKSKTKTESKSAAKKKKIQSAP